MPSSFIVLIVCTYFHTYCIELDFLHKNLHEIHICLYVEFSRWKIKFKKYLKNVEKYGKFIYSIDCIYTLLPIVLNLFYIKNFSKKIIKLIK